MLYEINQREMGRWSPAAGCGWAPRAGRSWANPDRRWRGCVGVSVEWD